jgi:hypothetical protein
MEVFTSLEGLSETPGINKSNNNVSNNTKITTTNNKNVNKKVENNVKLLEYEQDAYNLRNSKNISEKMKYFGFFL